MHHHHQHTHAEFVTKLLHNESGNKHDYEVIVRFCNDWMRSSQFIVKASKFLLKNATAVTSDGVHRKVRQYNSSVLYSPFPQYLRFCQKKFRCEKQKSLWWRRQRNHDNVFKWKHFPCYWPLVWRIHWSPVNSPRKGQWRGALMFSLIYA